MFKNWERWPENYICISGASRPPGIYPENWADFYVDITLKIKKELGIEVVFIDPSGDSFLYEVAVITNSFFLKPTLNLLIGSYVLGKAKVFLSGRFHPSILASLSGTPCVFLGANSHKTYSLQHVLEYEQIEVFSFENSKENLNNIIAKIENYIANEKKIRNRIINTVKSNAILASNGINNTIFK
ncbi:MAG: polysaccharide pyruvyl transferase family protein [Candidatus Paceibacterota bacterium]